MFKAIFCAIAMFGTSASAATMTFNNLWDYANNDYYSGSTYTEDGITVTGNNELGYWSSTSLHMDDFYYPSSSLATFTMGSRFSAVGFDLSADGFDYFVCDAAHNCTNPTYQNVLVQGYRNGSVVASLLFDMGAALQTFPVMLGGAFNNLSALSIEVFVPDNLFTNHPPGGYADCNSPCSHFTVDNVTLAPVPLPAALPLAAMGFGLLAMTARRRPSKP